MPIFHVKVKRDAHVLDPSSVDLEQNLFSQNAVHAAASALSLAGGGYAAVIEVRALRPVRGRSARTLFYHCSQGMYGFVFGIMV